MTIKEILLGKEKSKPERLCLEDYAMDFIDFTHTDAFLFKDLEDFIKIKYPEIQKKDIEDLINKWSKDSIICLCSDKDYYMVI
jgi:hypothetical protein